jgi:hypothetical protein
MTKHTDKPRESGSASAASEGEGVMDAAGVDRRIDAFEQATGYTVSPFWRRLFHALLSKDKDDSGGDADAAGGNFAGLNLR